MGAPFLDLHLRYLVEYGLRTIRERPDERILEIFGDAKLEPHAMVYGDDLLRSIKSFFLNTKIPVVLGYELAAAQIPGVTIQLQQSSPSQRFMGDAGNVNYLGLEQEEIPIIVPPFAPKELILSGSSYIVTPPDDMSDETQSLLLPGLLFRDYAGNEYSIGSDDAGKILLTPTEAGPTLDELQAQTLTVISPYKNAASRQGVMLFNEIGMVTVHGHADRIEGLWLWMAVQHSILKYRPLLEQLFGMMLTEPVSSDFVKDDMFLGENVWRRFITLGCQVAWTWDGPKQADIVAFISSIKASNLGFIQPAVDLPPSTP